MAIACLVLGIVSCVFAFVPYASIASVACGIVAIVLAVKVNKQLKEQNAKDGKVTAGLITGIVGTALSALWTILWFTVIGTACLAWQYFY